MVSVTKPNRRELKQVHPSLTLQEAAGLLPTLPLLLHWGGRKTWRGVLCSPAAAAQAPQSNRVGSQNQHPFVFGGC